MKPLIRSLFSPSLFFIPILILILTPSLCLPQSPLVSLFFDTVVVNHQRTCEVVVELTDTLFSAVEVGLGSL